MSIKTSKRKKVACLPFCAFCAFYVFCAYKKHLRGGSRLFAFSAFYAFYAHKKHLRGRKIACLTFCAFCAFYAFCACEIFLLKQKKKKRGFKITLMASLTILLAFLGPCLEHFAK